MSTFVLRRCAGALLAVSFIAAAGAQPEQASPRVPDRSPAEAQSRPTTAPGAAAVCVVFEIGRATEDWGRIVIEIEPQKAPQTVENFLRYVDEGFYDGTIFHRILPHFLIQGGGYGSLSRRKTAGLHPPVACEADNGLKNLRGTIAAARARAPDSATCQFFINVVDSPKLDHPGHDGSGYCVFGRVVEGQDVVDRIRDVRTRVSPAAQRGYIKARRANRDTPQPERAQPFHPPVLRRAYRVDADRAPPPDAAETPASPSSKPAADVEPPAQPDPADTEPDEQSEDQRDAQPGDEPEPR